MTNEHGLSLETDPVLKLTRENERLRVTLGIAYGSIEIILENSPVKYPHIAHLGQIALDAIKQELEKQDD